MTWLNSIRRFGLITMISMCGMAVVSAADKPAKRPKPASKLGAAAQAQSKPGATVITATPVEGLKIAKGFRVELLHTVPKETEGSWVSMCVDPKGRLIVCDQKGGLFRVTVPPATKIGEQAKPLGIEKIEVDIGEAQGLLWAFDSLYVNVNPQGKYEAGLYRVRDTNGDDKLDEVKLLRQFEGRGEHGPHAVLLAPDGKSLFIVCGNGTKLTKIDSSRVPRHWGEDHLLPRMPDGRGFMRDVLAPGGCIYQIDPDAKHWKLIANGFRNEYDAAFNRDGELFAYDADMEWDMNTPWYRPTRVNHVISGAEFGWRNGAGKYPAWYPDSFGAVVNVGPGSPTGVTFGYGAKFPAKYQEALFICDWSYGKLYAVHLTPDGSSYTGTLEEFVAGTPLPLTDLVINPHDGAMYFAIGGRDTQSGLYRVTYVGDEATAPSEPVVDEKSAELRDLRHKLEALHGAIGPDEVLRGLRLALENLQHSDRAIRFAARITLEHIDTSVWSDIVLGAKLDPTFTIQALLALVRSAGDCPFHRPDGGPPVDKELAAKILKTLESIDYAALPYERKLDLVRVYHVLFNRFGPPTEEGRERTIARFDAVYPAESPALSAEICNLLVYLQAPTVAAKTIALIDDAPTQEEQIDYARALRMLKAGWTPELRRAQFEWFVKAMNYRGGNSFGLFVQNIKTDAIATLTEAEKTALQPIIDKQPEQSAPILAVKPRPFVKEWQFEEIASLAQSGLTGRSFERGRQMFAAANCFACHRYDNAGGAIGPDLSSLAGRFSVRDVLESIMVPSKVVSDQYQAVTVVTADGREITGRIVNLKGNVMMINTNMLDPNALEPVDRTRIEEQHPAKLSMMPTGLLNTLKEDEILDLLAYLLSRGDRNSPMFQKGAGE